MSLTLHNESIRMEQTQQEKLEHTVENSYVEKFVPMCRKSIADIIALPCIRTVLFSLLPLNIQFPNNICECFPMQNKCNAFIDRRNIVWMCVYDTMFLLPSVVV